MDELGHLVLESSTLVRRSLLAGEVQRRQARAISIREPMKNSNELGEKVKSHREGLGLTQRSLAQKLGVEPSYVAFIES